MRMPKTVLVFAILMILGAIFSHTNSANALQCIDVQASKKTKDATIYVELYGNELTTDGQCPDNDKYKPIVLEDCDTGNTILGVPTWYKYLRGEQVSGKCRPVIDQPNDALPIVLAILEIAMTLGGLVAVVMIFVGGFYFITAQGEPDKAKGARQTIINALIGLVIILVAVKVISYFGGRLG